MQTAALSDVPTQGQELRYLTVHFRDLQGLRMAPFWLALLVLTSLAKMGSFSRGHLAWSAAVLIAAQFGGLHLGGRWYERRYGVVKESEPPVPSGLISILHPEGPPQFPKNPLARRYGYLSGMNAILFLLWTVAIIPDIFLGHRPGYWQLVMFVTVFQIFPRCVYPVTNDWSILLRRILAVTSIVAMIGTYLEFRFGRMDVWTWMTSLLSSVLLLDIYDHCLLKHLVNGGFKERSHES